MLKARLGKETVLKLRNEVGALNQVARTLSDKGIDLLAATTWVEGEMAVIRLVTNDAVRTMDALRAQGHEPREADVVLTELPHKPGMLRRLTDRLAIEEIDIHHLYATAPISQDSCLVAVATANNDRAVVLLNG
jgi:hypothetical protein